jgi:Ni,Fe-hydrogenase III small subunit/formate hydrogenlyase subunit 6/NADH:ubiquinone oxidoreductase subunit I
MLRAILRTLRTGVVTQRSPTPVPDRFRGAPRILSGRAFDALPPPSVCPSGAITGGPDAAPYEIDVARCIFCGRCALAAPGNAIELGREFELSARRREDLVVRAERGADGRTVVRSPAAPAEKVADSIRRAFGRSLHLRHLDSGSCNACDWELTALLNPVYDIRRLGIDFVASPRHADGVIVTGPVTRNLETAVRRTYEAVPDPRMVIAVGACAASGGIVGRSYASAGGVDQILPVDVFIPGCPPRPEAIVFGILLAVGRLKERRQKAAG